MIYPRFLGARSATLMSSALLLGMLLVFGLPPAAASASEGPCADGAGVTVIVDFTDVGGSIVARCASGDPATGRGALEEAGFVVTDSQPGMICAIDAQPNPCPATFEGSYWSYWHSSADGAWTSYQVGADTSEPSPGEIEGWRYNDGSAGPAIAPADVSGVAVPAAGAASADPATADPATADPATADPSATATPAATGDVAASADAAAASNGSDSADNTLLFVALGLGALLVALVVLFLVRSRLRRVPEED